ncbi:MAG TPA: MFS transporter [Thermomicrobiales bacterium]|jgi:MFS family permease|nr:MFS transporter [Thermomicrobiales bacterium]
MHRLRRRPFAESPGRRAAFHVLRHRDYRVLLIATSISALGSRFQFLAVTWWVYELTGSEALLGLIGLARFIPILLFGLFGGVLADRYDRRRTLIVTQFGLMATSSTLAILAWGGDVTIPLIFLLTALTAVIDCVAQPARSALIPLLVPKAEMPDAMTVNIMVGQTASIVGPALAGFVIAAFGTAMAFTLDAIGFVFAIAALLTITTSAAVTVKPTGNTLAAAIEGLGFLRRSPILLSVMSVDFFATFFGATTALLPVLAVARFDMEADGYGLLGSSIAVGALLGSMVVSVLPSIERPGRGVLIAVGLFGVAIIGLGLSPALWVAMIFLALSGATDAVSMALRHTVRNVVTPDALRGRISAAHSTFASGGPQLGDARAGAMAALIGVGPALVIGGIGVVATVAVAHVLVPALARTRIADFIQSDDELDTEIADARLAPPPGGTTAPAATPPTLSPNVPRTSGNVR